MWPTGPRSRRTTELGASAVDLGLAPRKNRARAWLAGEDPEVVHALSVLERSIAWPAQVPP